jgi:hypothetical protein
MQAANKLEYYLQQAALSEGSQRVQWLQKIREYMQTADPLILDSELAQITNRAELRMLQAAGIPAFLQTRFYVQYNKSLNMKAT